MKSKSAIIVPARSTVQVPVIYKGALAERDFLFEPKYSQDLSTEGGVFAYIVDTLIAFI